MYRPRHQPQLGRGVPVPRRTRGSRDCGPRTGQMGIDRLTRGQRRPGPVTLRERMGTPGPVPTSILDMKRGVESYDDIPGRRPLRYYVKRHIDDVKRAVKSGRFVQAGIDYGVWNELMRVTGDPSFRGGHSVGLYGQKVLPSGQVRWLLWDPLDDARRAGIGGPGPRWVPRWKVVRAMVALGGSPERIHAGVFAGGGER